MAIVRRLRRLNLQIEAKHTRTGGTYSLVKDREGRKYLQIDTYGSRDRKLRGKKSQSIRFAPEAVTQLKQILKRHF